MLPYMIMLEGFDEAYEGFVVQEKLQRPTVAVYNRSKCVRLVRMSPQSSRSHSIRWPVTQFQGHSRVKTLRVCEDLARLQKRRLKNGVMLSARIATSTLGALSRRGACSWQRANFGRADCLHDGRERRLIIIQGALRGCGH